MLKDHPERYATTGLDWSNPAHYNDIATHLHQALMAILASRQGVRDESRRRHLRFQQARVEQRLSVAERAGYRHGLQVPMRIDDAQVVLVLEKMADALEMGATAYILTRHPEGSNVMPGSMLCIAADFANSLRFHGTAERFSIGPFGALSNIAALLPRPDLALEMEDLPMLATLVAKAREIPSGHVVLRENETCAGFYRVFDELIDRLRKRCGDRG